MDEKRFWLSLEYRLCREFAGLPDRRYQNFWCDGFAPEDYLLSDPAPQIIGRCWICNGPAQAEWNFALLLPGPVGSREEIDWAALRPAQDVMRWMSFDERRWCIEIKPSAAVPDLAEPRAAADRGLISE
ncbi:MAG TPA: hypothetical protein VH092_11640 [Urbifossiella sp.]|nr:hypothetical protein [Urbifossiella sp.]